MEIQSMLHNTRTYKIIALLLISLGMGFLFEFFFYGQYLGLSFPLYVWLILSMIFVLLTVWKIKIHKNTYWSLPPLLFFPAMVAVHSSALLVTLNVLTTFLLIILILTSLKGEKIENYLIPDYVRKFFEVPMKTLHEGGKAVSDFINLRSLVKGHKYLSQIIKGMVMAIPVLIIFLALFSSADLIFQKYLLNLLNIDINQEIITKIITILAASFIVSGILRFATHSIAEQTPQTETIPKNPKKIGIVETSIFLGLINALFLAFILIQLTYFFGGGNNISVAGFTYSEYARKGFFELIAVAIISFFIIIYAEKTVERKNDNHRIPFQFLSVMLILEVGVIMTSAFQRLSLYENVFGFTELRLYSHLFIIWLGIIFLLLIYKILIDKRENVFAFSSFISSLAFLCLLNIFNPDRLIAQKNIEIFPATGRLDLEYLNNLSDDAIPEIIKIFDLNDPYIKQLAAGKLYQKGIEDKKNWQSWSLARFEAQTAIKSRWEEIVDLINN